MSGCCSLWLRNERKGFVDEPPQRMDTLRHSLITKFLGAQRRDHREVSCGPGHRDRDKAFSVIRGSAPRSLRTRPWGLRPNPRAKITRSRVMADACCKLSTTNGESACRVKKSCSVRFAGNALWIASCTRATVMDEALQ